MSMKKIIYLLAVIALCQSARAQKDSSKINELDSVVVTATKSNLKQSQTGKIVTAIDQKIIQNSAGRSLGELLNTQAGFFINGSNTTLGTNLDVYFRGASSGNMLIVIDGFAVYDPSQTDNSFDLNSIPLDQIEKIEILKGGQSTLCGSDAVAGVIQIFLKKESQKKFTANGSLSFGSYKTVHSVAGASGTINKLGYNIQYSYIKSRGISATYDSTGKANFDNEGFEQNNIKTELSYKINKTLSAKIFNNFNFYHNDLDEGAFTDDKDDNAKNKNNLAGLSLRFQKKAFTWNLQTGYQRANRIYIDDSNFISSPYSKYSKGSFTGNTFTIETYGTIYLAKHANLVSGVQYLHQNTKQSYININNVAPPYGPYDIFSTALDKDSAAINQASGYASLLIINVHGFNLETGGRINHHSIYGTNATYTVNPSYLINDNTKISLNISSAYKIPTLYQLYSGYGNKDLHPESSTTFEAALQTQLIDKKLSLRLVAFKRDIKNLIIFYTDTLTYGSKYVNRDKQNDYGFEIESNIQLSKFGNWSNNFSFVNGKGTEDKIKVSNLYRRPKFVVNSVLTLELLKVLTIMPSFKNVGSRLKGPYDAGPDKQPAYHTLDFFIAYEVIKNVRVFADLHNITAQRYFDIPGYNSKRFNMMAGAAIKL